ncbi:MAG: ATP-binding protein [Candidatus Cloacimonetes bacterium]|nr:ATP-binding protein [Candidatus Cloacimonadota bacterium]
MLYKRTVQEAIEKNLFKGKVIIVYGARRVGKTTLIKQLLSKFPDGKYINCDLLQYKSVLETTNSEMLGNLIGNSKLLILDEAQNIKEIGKILKIIVDTFPDVQVIATGSSSFGLSNKLSEPLTGRSRFYLLYPFSFEEVQQKYNRIELDARLGNLLRFGMYPEVFDQAEEEAIEELHNIASTYLYKDILQLDTIKRADLIHRLLKALALQLGNEISYNEIAGLLGENVHTIKRYIEILEQSFVVFRLPSFSKNLRKELGKRNKIYFFDLGIRNAIINNFTTLDSRNDTGALWENFCIVERMKHNQNHRIFKNYYFWRTYNQKEIDFIEEYVGKLFAFEFKWQLNKIIRPPKDFLSAYPGSEFTVISNDNYLQFI